MPDIALFFQILQDPGDLCFVHQLGLGQFPLRHALFAAFGQVAEKVGVGGGQAVVRHFFHLHALNGFGDAANKTAELDKTTFFHGKASLFDGQAHFTIILLSCQQ